MSFLAIEVGKHRIKILLLNKERDQLNILQEMIQVVPGHEDVKINLRETLATFIKKYRITSHKVFLTIYDPNIITIRNAVLPMMPAKELVQALTWHAKDENARTQAQVLFNYQVAKEFIDDDQARKCAVIYSTVHPKLLQSLLSVLTHAGFDVEQVTAAPLDYSKILTLQSDTVATQALLDIGYNHSTLAIYKRGQLIFFRDMAFSFAKIKQSLNDPLFLESQAAGEVADQKIEQVLQMYGIPDEETTVLDGSSRIGKFYALIRPLLEGLIREMRYSFSYYETKLKEDAPKKLFLTGYGTAFKNLEIFLARGLGMSVHNLLLPNKIQNRKDLHTEDTSSNLQANLFVSGVAGAFAGHEAVNFLPFEFRSRKFEAFQRKILSLVTTGVVGFLAVSFFFVKLETFYYSKYVTIAERHLAALGKFAELSNKAFPRYFLVSEIERGTVSAEKVLKLVGFLMPEEMVLKRFALNAAEKKIVLDVVSELPEVQRSGAVDGFVAKLKGTSLFASLSSTAVANESGVLFRIEGVLKDD